MSKTSARSKGYRKTKQPKKGYTPQEIRTMIIGFAVIIVVVIGVLVVPDFIESFHLLKVKDGVVQGVEDNWLICNTGTSSHKKYRKLAETEPVEGYELSSIEDGYTDANLRYITYAPADDSGVAEKLIVQPGNGAAAELVSAYQTQISRFGELLYLSDIEESTVNDTNVYSLIVEYRTQDYSEQVAAEEAEAEAEAAAEDEAPAEETAAATEEEAPAEETAAEEEAPAEGAAADTEEEAPAEETADDAEEEITYEYTQSVVLYIESPIDGKCVVINAMNNGADESAFGDRDAMLKLVLEQAACVTIEK